MDGLSHLLYGMTICSRSGLGGGLKKQLEKRLLRDWTVAAALLFSMLPDIISMGVPFLVWLYGDTQGNFFVQLAPQYMELYRYMHSLITAGAVLLAVFFVYRPLFLPSLAWIVHIIMDALTHNLGKFRTTPFYPFTDWAFEGIPFWMHPEMVLAAWCMVPIIWIWLFLVRRRGER